VTTLAIEHLSKTYADGTEALRDMHIVAHSGEIVTILGGSGCGKTTLLRLTAGLDRPSAGTIAIDGQPIEGTHPAISAVFQEPRLLPWLTVGRNIAFGGRRIAGPERQRRVTDLLERIGLAGYGGRWPKDLSGGQQQRVAIARADRASGDTAAGRAFLRVGRLHARQPARTAAGPVAGNAADDPDRDA
jgi:sulfonate transport system ATP-binding protein